MWMSRAVRWLRSMGPSVRVMRAMSGINSCNTWCWPVSAKDFDSCNCCVCYYMEGDKEWHFAQAGQSCLFGSTPKCVADSGDVCFFSNPFQVYLKLDANTDWSNVRPILYLKVLSFSFQNFLTSESFGLLEIPITRGRHSFAINTWKPFVRNRLQLMRQYFMGCVPVAHQMNLDSTLIDVSHWQLTEMASDPDCSLAEQIRQ